MSYAFSKCLEQQRAFEDAERRFLLFLESMSSVVLEPLSLREDVDIDGLEPLLLGVGKLVQFHRDYRSTMTGAAMKGRGRSRGRRRNEGAVSLVNEGVFSEYGAFPAVYGEYLQSVLASTSLKALSLAVAGARSGGVRQWLQWVSSTVTVYDKEGRLGAAYGSLAEMLSETLSHFEAQRARLLEIAEHRPLSVQSDVVSFKERVRRRLDAAFSRHWMSSKRSLLGILH